VGLVLLAWIVALAGGASPSPAPAHLDLVEGQVVKIDLSQGQLVVKVAGPRDLIVVVDGSRTLLSRQGRALRLDDVRAGERIVAACEDRVRGRCAARVIKVGTWKRPEPEAPKEAP
jgi:hypothetical protein